MTRYPEIKKQNLRMFILVIVGIALTLILMSLPLYTFDIGVYTKKSANTFVSDEKYATLNRTHDKVIAYCDRNRMTLQDFYLQALNDNDILSKCV